MDLAVFTILAALVIGASLTVVLHPDPVYSAVALVVTLCLLAVFFVTLDAHLVAALQVIVYAGAVMVLFLFVIMLLGRPTAGAWAARPALWVGGGLGAVGMAAGTVSLVARVSFQAPATAPPEEFGTTTALARELFTTYLLPFELTSVLLLIGVVGGVILAKGRVERAVAMSGVGGRAGERQVERNA
jgi:NADH-quinone oxidoreductase subunit J